MRRRSSLARPYICFLRYLSRLTWPSRLVVAPRRTEGGAHGRQVGVEASGEAPQLRDNASACPGQPTVEAGEVPAVDEAEEPLPQAACFGD